MEQISTVVVFREIIIASFDVVHVQAYNKRYLNIIQTFG